MQAYFPLIREIDTDSGASAIRFGPFVLISRNADGRLRPFSFARHVGRLPIRSAHPPPETPLCLKLARLPLIDGVLEYLRQHLIPGRIATPFRDDAHGLGEHLRAHAQVPTRIDKIRLQLRSILDANTCRELRQADAHRARPTFFRMISMASSDVFGFGTRISRPPDFAVTARGIGSASRFQEQLND